MSASIKHIGPKNAHKIPSFPSKSSNRVFYFSQCYEKFHSTRWVAKARCSLTYCDKMFLGSQLTYFYKSKTSLHFYKWSSTWFWIREVLSSDTHIWGCNWFFFSWYALCAITQGTTYCSECSRKTEMVCIYSNNSKWQHNSIWKQHEGSSCSLFNQRLEHMQRKLQNLPWTKYGSKHVL